MVRSLHNSAKIYLVGAGHKHDLNCDSVAWTCPGASNDNISFCLPKLELKSERATGGRREGLGFLSLVCFIFLLFLIPLFSEYYCSNHPK